MTIGELEPVVRGLLPAGWQVRVHAYDSDVLVVTYGEVWNSQYFKVCWCSDGVRVDEYKWMDRSNNTYATSDFVGSCWFAFCDPGFVDGMGALFREGWGCVNKRV